MDQSIKSCKIYGQWKYNQYKCLNQKFVEMDSIRNLGVAFDPDISFKNIFLKSGIISNISFLPSK